MKFHIYTKTAIHDPRERGFLPRPSTRTTSGHISLGPCVAFSILVLAHFVPDDLTAQNRTETNALTERDHSLLKTDTLMLRGQSVAVMRRSDTSMGDFILQPRGDGRLAVTFNECNNAAKETCGSGVQDVSYDDHGDDKPNTGDCSYSCYAPAGSSD